MEYTGTKFLLAVGQCCGSHEVSVQKTAVRSWTTDDDEDDSHEEEVSVDSCDDSTIAVGSCWIWGLCEVCVIERRDTRQALVPCGHQRFCASCVTRIYSKKAAAAQCAALQSP